MITSIDKINKKSFINSNDNIVFYIDYKKLSDILIENI
jgi:hypothetical protein